MFNLFTRKRPAEASAPRVHVVEPKPQPVNIKLVTGGVLRAGMWVRLGERTGILKEMNPLGVASVMLVDELGMNELEMAVSVGELRQAKQSEIPAARVANVSKEVLARMGYAS